jgi:hypothetical protein
MECRLLATCTSEEPVFITSSKLYFSFSKCLAHLLVSGTLSVGVTFVNKRISGLSSGWLGWSESVHCRPPSRVVLPGYTCLVHSAAHSAVQSAVHSAVHFWILLAGSACREQTNLLPVFRLVWLVRISPLQASKPSGTPWLHMPCPFCCTICCTFCCTLLDPSSRKCLS